MKGGAVGQYIFDVFNAGGPIGICLATSFLYCFIFIVILSFFAEPLCWACVVIVQLGLLGAPILFGWKYYDLGLLANSTDPPLPKDELASIDSQRSLYLAIAIGAGCSAVCFAVCLMCFFS